MSSAQDILLEAIETLGPITIRELAKSDINFPINSKQDRPAMETRVDRMSSVACKLHKKGVINRTGPANRYIYYTGEIQMHENLEALGQSSTRYDYDHPNHNLLERFPSPFSAQELNPAGVLGELVITAPEFTSLCPKTGQPDFATIIIRYVPDLWCVESKSLKLYLGSYRNFGEFHESCVNRICNDLVELLKPEWIEVEGQFTPRGGIPFWPTATWAK